MDPIHLDSRVLFSYAFRPFFLVVGIYAVLAVVAWGLHLGGILAWPDIPPAAVRHGHEMVFGFAGAAIAGFLLTAVATWIGGWPVAGIPLMILCAAWIGARLGAFLPRLFGTALWAFAAVVFWRALLALVAREIVAVRNARNYKVLGFLLAFLATEVYFFFLASGDVAAHEAALRTGLCLVVGMILLIGGRIIPSFTQNWLRLNRPELGVSLPPLIGVSILSRLLSREFL